MRALPERVADVVPHSGRMLLLGRVLEHSAEHTRCEVEVDRSGLFREADGSVRAWLGIEYMAQCVAAHGGLAARALGLPPRPAVLLGSRRLRLRVDRFAPGQVLQVTVRHHRGESGLVAFDCEVRDAGDDGRGEPLVQGRLNVYTVDAWEDLERRGRRRPDAP